MDPATSDAQGWPELTPLLGLMVIYLHLKSPTMLHLSRYTPSVKPRLVSEPNELATQLVTAVFPCSQLFIVFWLLDVSLRLLTGSC